MPLARELLVQIGDPSSSSVHGDFHHHNLLKHGDHYVATAAKIEGRIAAFTDAGLDDFRIRAWTVIRAVYLWPALGTQIAALI